eukprot:symbB.v1.2.006449.t1/scaffold384.1/size215671/22
MVSRGSLYPSRAFVFGGDGVAHALSQLCQECCNLSGDEWPQRMNQRVQGPGSLLLDDPLGRGATIELTFIEVPYWWVEADLRSCIGEGRSDCAVLVVDICNPDSFKAAVTRGKWAMSAGLDCQLVLSFSGPCGHGMPSEERRVPAESLEWLADEVSLVKPGHFDCTQANGGMIFQVELFLKVLTLRLLWLNVASGNFNGKMSGLYTPSTSTPSRIWTGPALSSRPESAPNGRQPRNSRSPGPPRCANILPARYLPGASPVEKTPRGRTCWGSEPRRSVSPRVQSSSRRRDRSPQRNLQGHQPWVLIPRAEAQVDVLPRDVSPARLAAAEAKRLVAEGQGRTPAVERARWEHSAKPQEKLPAPLETVVKLTLPGQAPRKAGAFKVQKGARRCSNLPVSIPMKSLSRAMRWRCVKFPQSRVMTSMVGTVHLRRAEPPLCAFSPFSPRLTRFPMQLGIRCLASRPSLYETLGVSPSATHAEIKKAYLTEAKKCHPDLNPSKDAKDRFQKLAEAYEVLGNLERRASYDYSLRSGPSYSGARRGTGTSPPGGSQHMDPSEVFRSVFEELGVDEVLERLRQVQQEGVVAANAAQAGNFTPAKTFVWKHKGVAAAVLLPLAILFRFPQIISISFRVLGLVAASLLQSPALREMMSRWVWLQWRILVARAQERRNKLHVLHGRAVVVGGVDEGEGDPPKVFLLDFC